MLQTEGLIGRVEINGCPGFVGSPNPQQDGPSYFFPSDDWNWIIEVSRELPGQHWHWRWTIYFVCDWGVEAIFKADASETYYEPTDALQAARSRTSNFAHPPVF